MEIPRIALEDLLAVGTACATLLLKYRSGAVDYKLLEQLGYSLVATPPDPPKGWGNRPARGPLTA